MDKNSLEIGKIYRVTHKTYWTCVVRIIEMFKNSDILISYIVEYIFTDFTVHSNYLKLLKGFEYKIEEL